MLPRRNTRHIITVLVLSTFTVILLFLTLDSNFPPKLIRSGVRVGVNSYLYLKPWRLIDIPIQYLINNDVCGESDVELLLLVTSHAGNRQQRNKLRHEFNTTTLESLGIRRLFLLAKTDPKAQSGIYHSIDSKVTNFTG